MNHKIIYNLTVFNKLELDVLSEIHDYSIGEIHEREKK